MTGGVHAAHAAHAADAATVRPNLTRVDATATPPWGGRAAPARGPSWVPRWMRSLLGVPLTFKIIGANALIVIAAAAALLATHAAAPHEEQMVAIALGALAAGLVVNVALVYVALRPLRELEETADRIWRGDLDVRVQPSLVASRDVSRVGGTLNVLLAGLAADRDRMRMLAAQVIGAGDAERARIARELHDSTAQQLAAVIFQLSAAVRDCTDPALAGRLEMTKTIAADVLEEIRTLSHTVHPRVLDDLGLMAALQNLARHSRESGTAEVRVVAEGPAGQVPPTAASVLYRVAQEALANALRHAAAREVTLRLTVTDAEAALEVIDDGAGFDVDAAEAESAGLGLFSMRERLSLVNGELEVDSASGEGTRVRAAVPLNQKNSGVGSRELGVVSRIPTPHTQLPTPTFLKQKQGSAQRHP